MQDDLAVKIINILKEHLGRSKHEIVWYLEEVEDYILLNYIYKRKTPLKLESFQKDILYLLYNHFKDYKKVADYLDKLIRDIEAGKYDREIGYQP